MAAAFVDPFLTRDLMDAEITLNGQTAPTWVSRLYQRGMLVAHPEPVAVGTLAWIDMALPNGARIRPLVEVIRRDDNAVAVRYRHVFPDHQRHLDAWRASSRA